MTKSNSESSFSTLDILHLLGLLMLGVPLLYGATYIFKGNLILSGAFTAVLILALYGIVNLLKDQKDKSENRMGLGEIIALVMFIIVTLITAFFVNHFLLTEFHLKKNVILQGQNKTKTYTEMFTAAETEITNYGTKVDSDLSRVCASKSSDYGAVIAKYNAPAGLVDYLQPARRNTISIITANEKASLENEIMPVINEGQAYASNTEKTFTNWDRLNIPQVNFELNERMNEDYVNLKKVFAKKDISFYHAMPNGADDINIESAKQVWAVKGSGLLVTIIFLIVANLLILATYIFLRRPGNIYVTKQDDGDRIK